MKDHLIITIIAIAALVILEAIAIFKGINGTLLSLVIGAICGLAGYEIKTTLNNYKK